jgi:hypothetical protein
MATLRQIEANRRNAQKSTGPTSPEGKAASSMNALKTGLHAKSLVLPSEDPADLELLIHEYYDHHQPASPDARAFVDDLILCEWTLRRLHATEVQMVRYQTESIFRDKEKFPLGKAACGNPSAFTKLQYRIDSTRRSRLRTLQALKELETQSPPPHPTQPEPSALTPSSQTTSPEIGFVPQSTPTDIAAALHPPQPLPVLAPHQPTPQPEAQP